MGYRWFDACARDDLLPGGRIKVDIDGLPLCVLHLDNGTLLAVDDACPHQGVSLFDGGIQEGSTLTCGAHEWCFDLQDGQCTEFPAHRLRRFPIAEEGDRYYVGLWLDEGDGPDPLNG